jgi:hypothetical protein
MFEMTIRFTVTDLERAKTWYTILLEREPDFIPHAGFLEWEIVSGCWLQLAETEESEYRNGPLRLGVKDLEAARERVMNALNIRHFDIHKRVGVPVQWGTFQDPWDNQLGFFEYLDKDEERERMNQLKN